MVNDHDHPVGLSAAFKEQLWQWLTQTYGAELRSTLKREQRDGQIPEAVLRQTGEHLQGLIRQRLAQEGLRDAEDVYQTIVGTASEEFWCDIFNQMNDDKDMA
jgi:hypothetical protein